VSGEEPAVVNGITSCGVRLLSNFALIFDLDGSEVRASGESRRQKVT
jgi:hypothetical protein